MCVCVADGEDWTSTSSGFLPNLKAGKMCKKDQEEVEEEEEEADLFLESSSTEESSEEREHSQGFWSCCQSPIFIEKEKQKKKQKKKQKERIKEKLTGSRSSRSDFGFGHFDVNPIVGCVVNVN